MNSTLIETFSGLALKSKEIFEMRRAVLLRIASRIAESPDRMIAIRCSGEYNASALADSRLMVASKRFSCAFVSYSGVASAIWGSYRLRLRHPLDRDSSLARSSLRSMVVAIKSDLTMFS